jgi:hypothetical protein
MKVSLFSFVAAMLLALSAGCVNTVYLEQETPAGTVPQVASPPVQGMEQGLQDAYQAQAVSAFSDDREAVIERFRNAYDLAGKPRLALYLNRALSDEVREWKANERIVVSGEVKAQAALSEETSNGWQKNGLMAIDDSQKGERRTAEGRVAAAEELSAARETYVEDQARSIGSETWEWAFEDGFFQPFFVAGANLVDRAIILRLAAASQGGVKQSAVKTLEIEALKDYADFLVEILVADQNQAGGDCEFKVSVKDVQSGQTVASTTSLYPNDQLRKHNYAATGHGFELQAEDPSMVGQNLALGLMTSLSRGWDR